MPLDLIDRIRAVLASPTHPDRLPVLEELERYKRRVAPLLFQQGGVDASGVRLYRIGTALENREVALLHPLTWALHRLAAGETLPLSLITKATAARQAARNQLQVARAELARHCPALAATLVFVISDKHNLVSTEAPIRPIHTA